MLEQTIRRTPMATIQQKQLFVCSDLENLGDLERLKLAIDYLPDEELVLSLEKQRDKGRDKYPVRAVWNSIIAGVVYEHVSIESLRRELLRNAQLRQLCGFDVLSGIESVPTKWAYSRFLRNLMKNSNIIEKMFNTLIDNLKELLPDLGEYLAFDGKGIDSLANGRKKRDILKTQDNRSDSDADWGVKKYRGRSSDGSLWEKDETKVITGFWNAVYNYKGDIFCVCPKTGNMRNMAFGGFEKKRGCLKYRCPAVHYGIECKGKHLCDLGKSIRIPLSENRRIFTPLSRSSYKWKNVYKMRTSVERVNSRLDVSFGFENHFIRGLQKMKVKCGIALCVMLSMAIGRIKEKRKDLMRSLVQSA
jgi:hypothetical protein